MKTAIVLLTALVIMSTIVFASPTPFTVYVNTTSGGTYVKDITRVGNDIAPQLPTYRKCDASSTTFDAALNKYLTWYEYAAKTNSYCHYLYLAVVVLPEFSTNINDAVWREEKLLNDMSSANTITVKFTPQAGRRYAVSSFFALQIKTYSSGNWITSLDGNLVTSTLQSEDVIGSCPAGKMMRNNWCYDAKPFCINQQGVNVCTNQFQLYCLDYGMGYDCQTNPQHFCADGQTVKYGGCYAAGGGMCLDGVCDDVVSGVCTDVNPANGICDDTDLLITAALCWDANRNGICDNVESQICYGSTGQLCTKQFDPVCVGNTTYPNRCFAECQGHLGAAAGACQPLMKQCDYDTDCKLPPKCNPPSPARCINKMCDYSAVSCSLRSCDTAADCSPGSICIGITATCDSSICNYHGKCAVAPSPDDLWTLISNFFATLWQSIKNALGFR